MLKERPHFPQRHYASSPARAYSHAKVVNMRPALRNHPAPNKDGLQVIIFSEITGDKTVQSPPATVATRLLIKP